MAQDDIDLLYRAIVSPEPIKLCYGDDRLAHRERKRLYRVRKKERHKARADRYSHPPRIPLDDLRMRVRRGNIYLGRADLLHGDLQSNCTETRPRPPEKPVDSYEAASLPRWPPFSRRAHRLPPPPPCGAGNTGLATRTQQEDLPQ
jgi:hypothetical protein